MDECRIKFVACAVLFAAWVGLVVSGTPHSDDIISFIKYALVGLGAHTAATQQVKI